MSKTQATITFLGKKRIIKKSVKNFRLALEFQKKDVLTQKQSHVKMNEYKELADSDLGNEDNYSAIVDATASLTDISIDQINASLEFIQETLNLSDAEFTKLEELSNEEVASTTAKISNLITNDDTDPKK
ncbi:hypothetical protein FC72_GL000533 [Companilactobacillus tucceti DSM 20183]|uniref:Uncharacterized protein n=2 Tax=Companilactobacillus TaxID=2767879 RepID=A0A0R1J8P3_9LACO|nr:hypothetical protein [Companilactobacillus tucceti]KRK64362.1 hypothetical protein FC72_GL000533 [Companilactobacillus tucceti DSM 20183]